MRAFYTSANGLTANLCQYLYRDTTRLVIHNAQGKQVVRAEFPTWDDAKTALRKYGNWTNELTNEQI